MKKQHGVALITILVMVALATILAAGIARQQALSQENTAYLMRQNQALLYAKSAEAFFIELLQDDARTSADVDHALEVWAQPMPAFPVENGTIQGQLQDESGKFNLNSLLKEDGSVNEVNKLCFERLLKQLGLSTQLSEAVIDWQDVDDLPVGSMGAESNFYAAKKNPYFAANTLFHDIAELKQVRGFEGENYQKIAPYIAALPDVKSTININMAPAIVLASLADTLDATRIQDELDAQKKRFEFFEQAEQLWELNAFQAVTQEQRSSVATLLSVKTEYFSAHIEANIDGRKRMLNSRLVRDKETVRVISRNLLPKYDGVMY
jgi:general secretion pathway protein K